MVERLKRRVDFKAAAKGVRVSPARTQDVPFTLQAARRVNASESGGPRVGFTVTKRVGNAVERNRIKRRLRAIADGRTGDFEPGTDYVLLARREALSVPYTELDARLTEALEAASRKLARQGDGRDRTARA